MKTALITGIAGQDGSYLTELLLGKGYRVVGIARRSSNPGTSRISHLEGKIELIPADILDHGSLRSAIEEYKPDEIYNLAAQSFVPTSWLQPALTAEFTAVGVTRILEAIKQGHPKARFYQASSSEMFGRVQSMPQDESTPFRPRSPYGVAKLYGHWITVNYRESLGIHASSGILFNHESPRRGIEFVTRKISYQVALIKHGKASELRLGNLDSRRDWGYAGDYVKAMWLMLQQDQGDDFVVATGQTRSVREFVEIAFGRVDLDWQKYVKIDEKFYRPVETEQLVGRPSKAREKLGWQPEVDFKGLVHEMVDADMRLVAGQK